MIRFRRPRTDDAEIIRLIKTELIPLSYTAHPRDASTIRDLPKRLRRGVTFVSSRTKTSKPQGFVHLVTIGETLLFDMLAVHPNHRGKQAGTMLMAQGEAYGRAQGCSIARLFVDDINPRASRLYARIGYKTIRHYPELRLYEMIKPLKFPF
ncbi:GNAT family N-acetyltransferase [Paenibacillus oenotherae]|uniref:GNAT family N-acetyltransferase n=1 Tax=Paenibacillus oenotherae TaxID=1435645 RepID=A0ABS7DAT1_9BACL|nr:GNAT family N-acetyltransferase [Paenibacillus oenotherae]MBW7476607.1 GNAT family N-acetyltransferase [Paenibacillus oenotherae]